jgi:hypothetical protein
MNHNISNLGRCGVHDAKMMQTMARTAVLDGCGGRSKGMGRGPMTADRLHVRVGLWGTARVPPIAALPTDNASWAGGAAEDEWVASHPESRPAGPAATLPRWL